MTALQTTRLGLALALLLGAQAGLANSTVATNADSLPPEALERLAAVTDPDLTFAERHRICLRAIADDPELAFEAAITWTGQGGGYRARHCEAMALFALGEAGESAARLDALVERLPAGTDTDIDRLRADYATQAAQGWLQAGETSRAWASADAALAIDSAHVAARVTRARSYFALDRLDDAETDLTSVLAFAPEHAEALRYRADVRLRRGALADALEDAELSLTLDPTVDTALVRGHIREAIAKGKRGETP